MQVQLLPSRLFNCDQCGSFHQQDSVLGLMDTDGNHYQHKLCRNCFRAFFEKGSLLFAMNAARVSEYNMKSSVDFSPFVTKVRNFAIQAHANVNQWYDVHPYSYHLRMVYDYGVKYFDLIPWDMRESVLASLWPHDVIEDAQLTYNDVKDACGQFVADIAYALTNNRGKSRGERANEDYYLVIRNTPYAEFAKVCDRLANMSYSMQKKNRMALGYARENAAFVSALDSGKYGPMYEELKQMTDQINKTPNVS